MNLDLNDPAHVSRALLKKFQHYEKVQKKCQKIGLRSASLRYKNKTHFSMEEMNVIVSSNIHDELIIGHLHDKAKILHDDVYAAWSECIKYNLLRYKDTLKKYKKTIKKYKKLNTVKNAKNDVSYYQEIYDNNNSSSNTLAGIIPTKSNYISDSWDSSFVNYININTDLVDKRGLMWKTKIDVDKEARDRLNLWLRKIGIPVSIVGGSAGTLIIQNWELIKTFLIALGS